MATATVKFTGRDDSRTLSANDLKKAGVEGFTKTTFARGEAVEVEREVAQALVEHEALFGQFQLQEREAPVKQNEATPEKKTIK